MVDFRELRTVKQLAEEAPFLTEGKLRWWIFNADTNGFGKVMIKVDGRVYIDMARFNKWLEDQRCDKSSAA